MLTDLGLTTYEEKCYLTLLRKGTLVARDLSRLSGVPYGRIYEVLHSLESKGIAGSTGGRPQHFFAIPPDVAVSKLVESRVQETEKLKRNADIIIEDLTRIHQQISDNEPMWKVAVGKTLYESYFSFLKETKFEFLGYMDIYEGMTKEQFGSLLEKYGKIMSNLSSKGVKLRLLIGIQTKSIFYKTLDDFSHTLSFLVQTEVRLVSLLPYPFSIIDGEKVVLKVLNPINPSEFLAAIYLRDRKLANSLSARFETLWETAEIVDLKLLAE
ncbi:MAG: TrmB family transcriptional regulator [Methanobacteriota archaeon]|nr:MAG: TrmB family transcriptional regulator [Euryarchaeota archaeon]